MWVPWQRPGFELAMMLHDAVEKNPDAEGIILASHGLFTWGATSRECYLTPWPSSTTSAPSSSSTSSGSGLRRAPPRARPDRRALAAEILPFLRGRLAAVRPSIGVFDDSEEALEFVMPRRAPLAEVGTSCPDHFVRTRIKPLHVNWDPGAGTMDTLREAITRGAEQYRSDYTAYYEAFATPSSPRLRDPNPSVVLVPGVGLFAFGANRREAGHTAEFYRNAIRVMAGATALGGGHTAPGPLSSRRARRRRRGSRPSTTTWRCRAARRSTSSTGPSKKPSCSGCRPEGTEPPDLRHRRRGKRHRPRDVAQGGSPRRAPRAGRPQRGRRRRDGGRRGDDRRRRRGAACAVDITSRFSIRAMLATAVSRLAASTSSSTRRPSSRRPTCRAHRRPRSGPRPCR